MTPETTHNPYAAPTFHPEAPAAPIPGHYAFVKNPRWLTRILLWLLYAYLFKTFYFVISQPILNRITARPSMSDAVIDSVHFFHVAVMLLSGIVSLATLIVFCMWIHRAALNSRGFGAQGVKDTPGWSVGWYFIPIMNLFRPYQSMKQIWQVSADPMDWKNQKGSPILIVWWSFWTILAVVSVIAPQFFTHVAMDRSPAFEMISSIFTLGLYCGLTISAIILVSTIHRRQQALVS